MKSRERKKSLAGILSAILIITAIVGNASFAAGTETETESMETTIAAEQVQNAEETTESVEVETTVEQTTEEETTTEEPETEQQITEQLTTTEETTKAQEPSIKEESAGDVTTKATEKQTTKKTEEETTEKVTEPKEAAFKSGYIIGGTEIVVTAKKGVIPYGTTLIVKPLSKAEEKVVKNTIAAKVGTDNKKVVRTASYDISLWKDGKEIQPQGNVKVKFIKDKTKNEQEVFHVSDNKKTATNMGAYTDGKGSVSITTTHFSIYTDVELASYTDVKTTQDAIVQDMAVDQTRTGVYKYNPDKAEVSINKKLVIPTLSQGQVFRGKEVLYNGDGTFTVTLYAKGANFEKDIYVDGRLERTETVYPVVGDVTITDTIGSGFEIISKNFADETVAEEGGKVTWTIENKTLPVDGTYAFITYTVALSAGAAAGTTYETGDITTQMIPDEYNTYYYTHEVITENVPVQINWNNGQGTEAGINGLYGNAFEAFGGPYDCVSGAGTVNYEGISCTQRRAKNGCYVLWYTDVSSQGAYNKYYHIIILGPDRKEKYRLDANNPINVKNPGGNGDTHYFTVTKVSEEAIPVPGHDANAVDVKEMGYITLTKPTADNVQTAKTAVVMDWDARTYQIDLYAWHNWTAGEIAVEGVTVKDYIDPRFKLISEDGVLLKAGDRVDGGGTVGQDTNGWYVIWENQRIFYAAQKEDGWHHIIYVRAKEGYIGGNDVTTNIKDISNVIVGETKIPYEVPAVNVKIDFHVGKGQEVIFYGEQIADFVTKEDLADIIRPAYTKDGQEVTYTDLSDVTVTTEWFLDKACTIPVKNTDQTGTVDALLGQKDLEKDTTYYGKVTVTPKTDGSLGKTATAGHVNEAVSKIAEYAIYVVKGQLQITKNIDARYTGIRAINANQSFVFRIERRDTENGPIVETYYEVLDFDANVGELSQTSAAITGLKKGFYTVTEETAWSAKYNLAAVGNNYQEANNELLKACVYNLPIGKRITAPDVPEFYGLEQKEAYLKVADGEGATTTFVNELDANWKWLSDVAAAVNRFFN